jgi:hypothetical protein
MAGGESLRVGFVVTVSSRASVLLFGGVGFAVLPFDFTAFVEFVRSLGLPSVVTGTFKFIIAWQVSSPLDHGGGRSC